jgi:PKD repeat protein
MNDKSMRGFRLCFCFLILALIFISLMNCDDGMNFLPKLNESPIAKFDCTKKEEGTLTWLFNSEQSYDPDGQIVSYIWDFGDRGSAEGVNTFHIFKEPGLYVVKLTVIDDDDAMSSVDKEVEVYSRNLPPVAWLELNKQDVKIGEEVRIDGSKSCDEDGFIEKYQFWIKRHSDGEDIKIWEPSKQNFQDFSFRNIHLPEEESTTIFRVYLKVWDDKGETSQTYHLIIVHRE